MKSNPGGRRPRGRPRQRWWNQVKADMDTSAGGHAEDRSRWKRIDRTAKYQLGYK